ncbi:alpha/beta fold hydrolase [Hymenobacter rubripertinctus]|uniref:alpha/beta fold hydrolase n=1 Tax=Hymenobacter rubripertinctus TaxID=2029981 RepID=UPI0016027665|nr:alpha/beta hydrolase [Hymenobacter rubripertinctus]
MNYGQNAAAGQFATVNGTRIYYETYGQGEPLLLLHGNGESISSFRQQLAALAREYQVIAVDTRDQGQSAATKGRLSYDLFADDMHALLEQLQLPAAHIVGWSDGGNTGLSMALRYPAQVKSLVTMGANLYADTTAVDPKMLKEVRQGKLLFTALSPFKKSFRRGRRLSTMLLKYPQMTPAQLRAITAPVLVLAGEKDIIREAHTRLIARSIPRGEVVILPGLTHYAPQENGPLFNETVLGFLRRQRLGQ